jgi:hypothetical protein
MKKLDYFLIMAAIVITAVAYWTFVFSVLEG